MENALKLISGIFSFNIKDKNKRPYLFLALLGFVVFWVSGVFLSVKMGLDGSGYQARRELSGITLTSENAAPELRQYVRPRPSPVDTMAYKHKNILGPVSSAGRLTGTASGISVPEKGKITAASRVLPAASGRKIEKIYYEKGRKNIVAGRETDAIRDPGSNVPGRGRLSRLFFRQPKSIIKDPPQIFIGDSSLDGRANERLARKIKRSVFLIDPPVYAGLRELPSGDAVLKESKAARLNPGTAGEGGKLYEMKSISPGRRYFGASPQKRANSQEQKTGMQAFPEKMLSPGKKNISLKNTSQSVYDISIIKVLKKYMAAESPVERGNDGSPDMDSLMPEPARLTGRNRLSGRNTGFGKPAAGAGVLKAGMKPEESGKNISKYGYIDKKTGIGQGDKVGITYKGAKPGAKAGASGLFARLFVPDSGHIGEKEPEYTMTKKTASARAGNLKQDAAKITRKKIITNAKTGSSGFFARLFVPDSGLTGGKEPEYSMTKKTAAGLGGDLKQEAVKVTHMVYKASGTGHPGSPKGGMTLKAPSVLIAVPEKQPAGGHIRMTAKEEHSSTPMPREVMIYPGLEADAGQARSAVSDRPLPEKKEVSSDARFSSGKKYIMHSSLSQTKSEVKKPEMPDLVPAAPARSEAPGSKITETAPLPWVPSNIKTAPSSSPGAAQRTKPANRPVPRETGEPESYDNFNEDNYSKYLHDEEEKESLYYEGSASKDNQMFMLYPKKQTESSDFQAEEIDMELKPLVEGKEFVKPDQKK